MSKFLFETVIEEQGTHELGVHDAKKSSFHLPGNNENERILGENQELL